LLGGLAVRARRGGPSTAVIVYQPYHLPASNTVFWVVDPTASGTNYYTTWGQLTNFLTAQWRADATNAASATTALAGPLTSTNGFIFRQLSAIPTNYVPASSSITTNWLDCNTNGTRITVATNYNNSPAGQAFFVKVLAP
jgi:hypothetical protein